jgi:predicted P-loop ATPase
MMHGSTTDLVALRAALAHRAADLAVALLGNPNPKIKCKGELRYEGNGSFVVTITGASAGLWCDYKTNEGGDMLDLIMRERHCDFPEALAYANDFCGVAARGAHHHHHSGPDDDAKKQKLVSEIWDGAVDAKGTLVETYLASRGLVLPDNVTSAVIRFHPALYHDHRTVSGMVVLYRDIVTDKASAIHRTFLNNDGTKIDRKMLGPVRNCAIKLSAHADVSDQLSIGEGVETGLAGMMRGFSPMWVIGSAGAIASFPIVPGVKSLTILTDNDKADAVTGRTPGQTAAKECSKRWTEAGCEVRRIIPDNVGDDIADVVASGIGQPGYRIEVDAVETVSKPITINWAEVAKHTGWVKGISDLPDNFNAIGKALVAHTGSIEDLKVDLKRVGAVTVKPVSSWAEAAFALTMSLRDDGRLPAEKIAAALLCPLACNQYITKMPTEAEKHNAIERLMWRTQDQTEQAKKANKDQKEKQEQKDAKEKQELNDQNEKAAKIASEPPWRERRNNGSPLPSMHNARLAINTLGIKCTRDVFHNKTLFGFRNDIVRHELQSLLGEVTDDGVIALRQFMSDKFGFDLEDKATRDAVRSLALNNCFNPVCDLIDKAQADWDGVERLDAMAVTHFNCEDTPLNRAFLRKTMIAMIARARQPGCKYDTITVLESIEGYNKSTAWRVLAGDENFSDETVIGKQSREVQEQLSEIWLHENADLAGMKKAEVEVVKAFASRTTDIARAAFAHYVVKQLRHSIEVGSTNSEEYLQSQTGNRRFWPLKVLRAIDIAMLKRDRLQLIGEAATYQAAGESVTLAEAMWPDAGVQQDKRRIKHPWEAVLAVIHEHHQIADPAHPGGYKMKKILHYLDGEERVSSRDLLTYVLGLPIAYQTVAHTMQLSTTMKRLGWERTENKITIEQEQVRGFYRKVTPQCPSDEGVEEL